MDLFASGKAAMAPIRMCELAMVAKTPAAELFGFRPHQRRSL
ncbi:hypothetical protein OHB12_15255 [Nocardia sp. NBC_01730]|nr:hypothetical protein OHB12_15255 [Nocardia sp. NBC_01730]